MLKKTERNTLMRCLCLTLILALGCVGLFPALGASAAGTPTALGLAEHGIRAYQEGWQYEMGATGQYYGGVRYTDCAGLITSYFNDCGIPTANGATTQVRSYSRFDNELAQGIPRIHGLLLTAPDRYDPYTGVYGHIGIYIGDNYACDNSSSDVDMLCGPVYGSYRGWTAWHVMDHGLRYPKNGWFAFNGGYVHYTDCEYDVSTTIDGIAIGADGMAEGSVPSSLLGGAQWTDADEVAAHLAGLFPNAQDLTEDYAYGRLVAPDLSTVSYGSGGVFNPGAYVPSQDPSRPFFSNATISGDVVNLRKEATTKSASVGTFRKGDPVSVQLTVRGEAQQPGASYGYWYYVTNSRGVNGYVYSTYVTGYTENSGDGTPYLFMMDGYVMMSSDWERANIYYTTDGSEPTTQSTIYTGPQRLYGCTVKAIAQYRDRTSSSATLAVFDNGLAFTDIKPSGWYYDSVKYAVENDLMNGMDAFTFSPNGTMTRGQFVTVLGRMAGVDQSQWHNTRFKDVSAGDYFEPYVAWAAENGVVKGTSDTTFSPKDAITREQIATILFNYIRRTDDEADFSNDRFLAFSDFRECHDYSVQAMQWATDKGILQGDDKNRLLPRNNATRAQVATIFMNSADLLQDVVLMEDSASRPAVPLSQSELAAAWLDSDSQDLA